MSDFSEVMNAPEGTDGTAYIEVDYKTCRRWVMCPYCGKKQFPLTVGAHITGQVFRCKGSNCKSDYMVNVQ